MMCFLTIHHHHHGYWYWFRCFHNNNTIHFIGCVCVCLCYPISFGNFEKILFFVFCLLNLETKICFFDMVLGTQNVDIHFSIHLIRLNVISTFVWKNASLTNSFFLFFFGGWKSEWSWIEGMMKNLNFSQHKCVQYAFNNILKTKTNVWLLICYANKTENIIHS